MGSKMRWSVLAASVFIASGSGQASGDITYELVNNPAYQSGWTLSGSITTDGTLGSISAADITSWTWTATDPDNTFGVTITSTSPTASVSEAIGIEATSAALTIPVSTSGGLELSSAPARVLPNVWVLGWNGAQQQSAGGTYFGDFLFLFDPVPPYVPIPGWACPTPPADGPNDTYILANAQAVPEPSSFVLAGLAGVFGISLGLARRLRS
jgi:hypothetical protein